MLNQLAGLLWIGSACCVGYLYYRMRGRVMRSVLLAAVVLTLQTIVAFALLGFGLQIGVWAGRSMAIESGMGLALALSVPIIWAHILWLASK